MQHIAQGRTIKAYVPVCLGHVHLEKSSCPIKHIFDKRRRKPAQDPDTQSPSPWCREQFSNAGLLCSARAMMGYERRVHILSSLPFPLWFKHFKSRKVVVHAAWSIQQIHFVTFILLQQMSETTFKVKQVFSEKYKRLISDSFWKECFQRWED